MKGRLEATHDRNRPLHYGTLQQPWLLMANLGPADSSFGTTGIALRPDSRPISTAVGPRADLPWAALDRPIVTLAV
jgi:hypothetical protein